MIREVLAILANTFNSLFALVQRIYFSLGGFYFVVGMIFAFSVLRFIILPFLKGGVGSSDPVKIRKPRQVKYNRNKGGSK